MIGYIVVAVAAFAAGTIAGFGLCIGVLVLEDDLRDANERYPPFRHR